VLPYVCLFCVILCIVCVYMCTEPLPPGGYPIAVKYIISYIVSYHIISLPFAGQSRRIYLPQYSPFIRLTGRIPSGIYPILFGVSDNRLLQDIIFFSTFKRKLSCFFLHILLLTFDRNMLSFSRLLVKSVKRSSLSQSLFQNYKL
jgi:hypothetical protein